MAVVTSDSRVRILKLTPLGLHARAAHGGSCRKPKQTGDLALAMPVSDACARHWNTSSQGRLAQVAQLVVAKPRFPREC